MNPLLALALAAVITASSFAADVTFYLGTYTDTGRSKGIYVGTLDLETGRLGPIELAGEASSPSFLALSPGGKNLYAALEDGGGSVGAFAVQPNGKLRLLNTKPSGGEGTCHVWVDGTDRNVFLANYNGGSIAVFRRQPDGSLGERSAFVQFTGAGPDRSRQEKPHAHSIYTDPANRFVYACDLGTDNIWIYQLNLEKGTLTPAESISGKVPPGAGPRHLAFHPSENFAYVCNEMGLSVTAFSRQESTGALSALQTLPTISADTDRTGISTAEIIAHPTGKWLYVSNRGQNTIAVYAIGKDGKLTWIESAPAQVKVPRGCALDPSGRWLITAGQDDNRIAVLKVDPISGKLTATDQSAEVGAPVCVLFNPAKVAD